MTSVRRCRNLAAALALGTLAAGPTTRVVDKTLTEYAVPSAAARFRAPTVWPVQKAGGAEGRFVFDPSPVKRKSVLNMQQVEVYLDKPTPTQHTTEDVVADLKAALLKHKPTLKFVKDGEATYAGRKVWRLQWNQRIELRSPDGQRAGVLDFDRISYVWIEKDTLCQIGLQADTRVMDALMRRAEPVARSIAWDG